MLHWTDDGKYHHHRRATGGDEGRLSAPTFTNGGPKPSVKGGLEPAVINFL
jgi:hypothetical protein